MKDIEKQILEEMADYCVLMAKDRGVKIPPLRPSTLGIVKDPWEASYWTLIDLKNILEEVSPNEDHL